MTIREQILQQALTLSPSDQAYVALELQSHLIANLSPETDESMGVVDDALLAELRRRSAAYRSRTTTAREASDVMAELWNRQSHEMKK